MYINTAKELRCFCVPGHVILTSRTRNYHGFQKVAMNLS